MDNNKKVHPVFTQFTHPSGNENIMIEGETYFERCAREFTSGALISGYTETKAVTIGIKTAILLQRKLKEINEFPEV